MEGLAGVSDGRTGRGVEWKDWQGRRMEGLAGVSDGRTGRGVGWKALHRIDGSV